MPTWAIGCIARYGVCSPLSGPHVTLRLPVTSLAAWYNHVAVQQPGGRWNLQHSLLCYCSACCLKKSKFSISVAHCTSALLCSLLCVEAYPALDHSLHKTQTCHSYVCSEANATGVYHCTLTWSKVCRLSMAAITVQREGTGDIITFDTVAEVGSAAEFISSIEKVWGEGVLLKPSSTSAFTARTPEPFPHGIYTFLQKSGTAVNTTLCKSYLAAYSTGSRPSSVI